MSLEITSFLTNIFNNGSLDPGYTDSQKQAETISRFCQDNSLPSAKRLWFAGAGKLAPMTNQASEFELPPIRGDVFVDRILGWLCIFCCLPVLGFSISKLLGHLPEGVEPGPPWLEPTRTALICLGLVGLLLATRSTAKSFRGVLWLYVFRLAAVLALGKWALPRYSGSEAAFDIVVIAYSLIRVKKLEQEPG